MKKAIFRVITLSMCLAFSMIAAEKHPITDTVPKKEPDTVLPDARLPEKNAAQKGGTIKPRSNKPDDRLLQPDSLRQMAREPANWPLFLELYSTRAENLAIRRAIVGHLRDEMTKRRDFLYILVAPAGPVQAFILGGIVYNK